MPSLDMLVDASNDIASLKRQPYSLQSVYMGYKCPSVALNAD